METFFNMFELEKASRAHLMIIGMYFSFTSLSTVGFGDFHPKSDFERIFCAMILVGGVMIFSYIMGNFISMLDVYAILKGDIEDGDNLSRFFGLMKKYNQGKDINDELKKSIEEYFIFRWQKDRMQAIDD